jgi:hypothetical protein
MPHVYERSAGNLGFLGTWDSESAKVIAKLELEVQPRDNDGLLFKRSYEQVPTTIKLDGKDHSDLDHVTGTTYSGRRVDDHGLEITEKSSGKVIGTRQLELSRDLNSLTVTEQMVGQSKPRSLLMFERQWKVKSARGEYRRAATACAKLAAMAAFKIARKSVEPSFLLTSIRRELA